MSLEDKIREEKDNFLRLLNKYKKYYIALLINYNPNFNPINADL